MKNIYLKNINIIKICGIFKINKFKMNNNTSISLGIHFDYFMMVAKQLFFLVVHSTSYFNNTDCISSNLNVGGLKFLEIIKFK